VLGGVYVGAQLAIRMSNLLEEWEIYSAEDDDDNDD
jgi:Putative mitochondrial precursor protein